jgi:helix-turn-helix resolvase-like protein
MVERTAAGLRIRARSKTRKGRLRRLRHTVRNGALVARTEHRHNQVRTLRQEGKTIRAIMRDLGLSRGTVRRFVRADHVDDLVAKPRTRPAPGYRRSSRPLKGSIDTVNASSPRCDWESTTPILVMAQTQQCLPVSF